MRGIKHNIKDQYNHSTQYSFSVDVLFSPCEATDTLFISTTDTIQKTRIDSIIIERIDTVFIKEKGEKINKKNTEQEKKKWRPKTYSPFQGKD